MIQQTSLMAYRELDDLGTRRAKVYKALRELTDIYGDATDQEIKQYLNLPDANFVRPRRFELVNELKLVGCSQKRICRVTGKTSIAWKVLKLIRFERRR